MISGTVLPSILSPGQPGDPHWSRGVLRVKANCSGGKPEASEPLGQGAGCSAMVRVPYSKYVQNCSAADLMLSWDWVYVSSFTAQSINRSLSEAPSPGRAQVAAALELFPPPPPPPRAPVMSLLPHSVPKGQHPLSLQCLCSPSSLRRQQRSGREGTDGGTRCWGASRSEGGP